LSAPAPQAICSGGEQESPTQPQNGYASDITWTPDDEDEDDDDDETTALALQPNS
jgi:hypothetical protein